MFPITVVRGFFLSRCIVFVGRVCPRGGVAAALEVVGALPFL